MDEPAWRRIGRQNGGAEFGVSRHCGRASDNKGMDASIYRLRLQDILALCVMGLLFLGILMVQSAAMNVTGEATWQWTGRGSKHLLYAGLALITFFVVGQFDYSRLVGRSTGRSPILWLLGIAVVMCVLVLIPGIGMEVNGARRWIPLLGIQIQPSELGKWGIVLFLAWWLARQPVELERFWTGYVPTLIPIGVICLLVVIQDFGTAALIGLCGVTMLLAGRVRLWHLAISLPPAMVGAIWFVASEPYRWRRMTSFLNPWSNPQTDGYHMIQSLLSFSSGGLAGRGLGNGVQKLGYLPEDTTDFIFAVICEELGLFGAMLTILLYLGILFVAWRIVRRKRDSFGRMLAFGVAAMTGLQAAINIAVATVSVPTKGLALPLVSAGGSGLIITCCALGLLYSVARHGHPAEQWELPLEQPKRHRIEKQTAVAAAV